MAKNNDLARKNVETDIFLKEKENCYHGDKSYRLKPEYRIPLPIKGLDPDCPSKKYKVVSIHINGNEIGIAPVDQEAGFPSRFYSLERLSHFIPEKVISYFQHL